MDDFVISNLHEAKNEWCSRLVSIFSPLVIEGIKSIFNESWQMCLDSGETTKYLMTFQNLLSRVPKWNSIIIEEERVRIIERSGCNYLEDLITCVHIIQLKVLTCIRVGNKQKQIDISIPKLDSFIHKIYIHVARKIYMNVYLFEKNIGALQMQKNGRELEMIVQECIMTTIRESIPTEDIIRAYMDESIEHEETVTFEEVENPVSTESIEKVPEISNDDFIPTMGIKNKDEEEITTRLKFNDFDSVLDEMNSIGTVNAPKTIERLEDISTTQTLQRKLSELDDDDEEDKIKIHTDSVSLNDILDMNENDNPEIIEDISLFDVEELN
jgi:hypothetical protein